MKCVHPLTAFRVADGSIVFDKPPVGAAFFRELRLRCGQCVGCRLERSAQWAVRVMHENHMHHGISSFVTLTYSPEKLPPQGQLVYRDYQLFMKKVRNKFGPTRFFMAGEYGSANGRPHFHSCLFGTWFKDRVSIGKSPSGSPLFKSATLESLWPHGYSSVGDVTFESAAYVARYICDKVTGDLADDHYLRHDEHGVAYWLEPEFCCMSRRPGIGADWYRKYYNSDVKVRDSCIVDGRELSVPRYYDKLLERENPELLKLIKRERVRSVDPLENTEDRLAVQEVVMKARLSFNKRGKV
ncbi:MAG: replication initiator protein [Microviridae sp.]|nr:MAG: replication initiator protein [Microviridae sp.]